MIIRAINSPPETRLLVQAGGSVNIRAPQRMLDIADKTVNSRGSPNTRLSSSCSVSREAKNARNDGRSNSAPPSEASFRSKVAGPSLKQSTVSIICVNMPKAAGMRKVPRLGLTFIQMKYSPMLNPESQIIALS